MKVLDLFSGIGGFSIGLEKAGFETVAFCEIERYCQEVLRRHWPDTPIYDDVRSLTGEQLRADGIVRPDVIVGGYPCQPFSVAGKQRGAEDDRHLWPEVYRLVKEIRPTWGIFENVAGHITMGLDEVLSDLEAEDYAARPFVIPACGVDAPHRRDRVWIVAHANSEGQSDVPQHEQWVARATTMGDTMRDGRLATEVGTVTGEASDSGSEGQGLAFQSARASGREHGEGLETDTEQSANVGDTQRSRQSGDNGRRSGQEPENGRKDVAYTSSQRLQGRAEEQAHRVGDLQGQSERSGENRADFWAAEPSVGRVANGVSNRSHRIKALGNAVVPQIPEQIGRIIKQLEGAL
jgi:DNA (cytosine-5)-methyltransferase 1